MRLHRSSLALALALLALPSLVHAGIVASTDFGDAPEGIVCYPDGAIGHFPSCLAATPPGTQQAACAAPGTAPGPTGFVRHFLTPDLNFWIGCGSPGIDFEPDAKVGPAGGTTCGLVPADCIGAHGDWGGPPLAFEQDECAGDGVDAMGGFGYPYMLAANEGLLSTISFPAQNAGPAATAYLNVLVDMNADGDWNDVIADFSPCHPEWAVKNHVVSLPTGCTTIASPPFQVTQSLYPNYFVPSWVRITLSGVPVPDDFAWNGSTSTPDGWLLGGETEDYPVVILFGDPVTPTSWGRVKTIYR